MHCDGINPKKKKTFSFSGQPVSLKQKVQHASAPGDYGGLVCLYHSLLSALGVGVGVCISLSRNLKILASACQVNFQTKKMRHHRFSAVPKALCQWDRACHPTGLPLHTHTHQSANSGYTFCSLSVLCSQGQTNSP